MALSNPAKIGLFQMKFVVSNGKDERSAAIVRKGGQSQRAYSFNFLLNLRNGSLGMIQARGHAMRAWIDGPQEQYLLIKAAIKDEGLEPNTFNPRITRALASTARD
ncbi:hypothetical protein ABEF95_003150 [Exophiala dermatitidis]